MTVLPLHKIKSVLNNKNHNVKVIEINTERAKKIGMRAESRQLTDD